MRLSYPKIWQSVPISVIIRTRPLWNKNTKRICQFFFSVLGLLMVQRTTAHGGHDIGFPADLPAAECLFQLGNSGICPVLLS